MVTRGMPGTVRIAGADAVPDPEVPPTSSALWLVPPPHAATVTAAARAAATAITRR